jgi:hypothetical protein
LAGEFDNTAASALIGMALEIERGDRDREV